MNEMHLGGAILPDRKTVEHYLGGKLCDYYLERGETPNENLLYVRADVSQANLMDALMKAYMTEEARRAEADENRPEMHSTIEDAFQQTYGGILH